jgi:hypothetical protein
MKMALQDRLIIPKATGGFEVALQTREGHTVPLFRGPNAQMNNCRYIKAICAAINKETL